MKNLPKIMFRLWSGFMIFMWLVAVLFVAVALKWPDAIPGRVDYGMAGMVIGTYPVLALLLWKISNVAHKAGPEKPQLPAP